LRKRHRAVKAEGILVDARLIELRKKEPDVNALNIWEK
jgi:hypothetical protein